MVVGLPWFSNTFKRKNEREGVSKPGNKGPDQPKDKPGDKGPDQPKDKPGQPEGPTK